MRCDLLIHNIGQLVTLAGPARPRRGGEMRELGVVEHGAVAIAGGRIAAVGTEADLRMSVRSGATLDAGGCAIIPGFVDPHTHLPWVGHRAHEFELRIAGATYMEIMAAGGGIVRTVTDTRGASVDRLVTETAGRARRMLTYGTTTAEAKTGYGLNVPDELKQLEAIARLQEEGSLDLVPTFLGAHAVPAEYRDHTEAYVDLVVEEMLPAAWAKWQDLRDAFPEGWPIFCDVFCEDGAFSLAQSRRILEAAKQLGFQLKMHVDEFAPLGGTPLAVELGATSVDHIVTTPPEHVALLARSDTIGVALPGTPFGLGHHEFSPARALIDGGGALALATDLNPGTSWCENMQLMLALACRYMKLLPTEALVAATLNGAYAIGLGHLVGSLEVGKQADLLVLDADDYRMLPYRYGTNLVRQVIKRGRLWS
ncbi:MAG: imidazolonepropionase [Nitrososphaerales archaeon]